MQEGIHKATYWHKFAPVFRLDCTLQQLFAKRTNNPKELQEYIDYCNGDLQSTPILPFSAKYVDSTGTLVAAYYGKRLDEPMVHLLSIYSTHLSLTCFSI